MSGGFDVCYDTTNAQNAHADFMAKHIKSAQLTADALLLYTCYCARAAKLQCVII